MSASTITSEPLLPATLFIDPSGFIQVWTVAALVLLIAVIIVLKNQVPAKNAPPKSTIGMLQTMSHFIGPDAPAFCFELQRKLNASVFQLNLPLPGGFYVVGSSQEQRAILTDKTTEKPAQLYSVFDGVTKYPTILTRKTEDPVFKHTRKAAATAFSSNEVGRMNKICTKQVERWAQNTLEPLLEAKRNGDAADAVFDPSAEMAKVVFHSLMEASFEYESTDEEFEFVSSNLHEAMQEFGYRHAFDPVRRMFHFLYPDGRKAMACSVRLREFAHNLLVSYRNNPNKSKNRTIIQIVENGLPNHTDEQKAAEIIVFILAGLGTSSDTVSNGLVILAQHPEEIAKYQESLREEDPDIAKAHAKRITTELTRMAPSLPLGSTRRVRRDFTFLDERSGRKTTIPNGAHVMIPVIMPCSNAEVFPNPEKFMPSRWVDATKSMTECIIPFALGARRCVAQSLGSSLSNTVLPKLMSKYSFEVTEEGKRVHILGWRYVGTKVRATKLE